MPIKRLVQQREAAALPRLGVLRKGGEKRTNDRGREIFGKDLDYFRFDTEDDTAYAAFVRIFGEQPRLVRVVLPYPTMEQNFQVWQEAYTAGALQHRCDGETCVRWLDPRSGRYSDVPVPCPGGCKEVGRLTVMVPDLQRMAHVTVLTHSINDIVELQKNILAIEEWRGDVRGIVWALSRKPVEISTPRDGKRVRVTKWLLFMEPVAEYAASLLQATTRAALTGGARAALPDGRQVNTGTGEVFDVDAVDLLDGEAEPETMVDIPPNLLQNKPQQDIGTVKREIMALFKQANQRTPGPFSVQQTAADIDSLSLDELIAFRDELRRTLDGAEVAA